MRSWLPDQQVVEGVDEDVAEVNVVELCDWAGVTMIEAELVVMVGAKDRASALSVAVRGTKEKGVRSRCRDTLSSLKDARVALVVAHYSRRIV
jgi:hypothetical protein